MNNIVQVIRKVIKDYINSYPFVDTVIATITSIKPLQLQIPLMKGEPIPEQAIIVSSNCKEKTIDIIKHKHKYFDSDTGEGASGSETRETEINLQNIQFYDEDKPLGLNKEGNKLIVNDGLKEGDKVLVLITNHFKRYIILTKL